MPRYYLNVRRGLGSGELIEDQEGDELAHEGLVRGHALAAARGMMRVRSHAVRDWMTCSFEIVDEEGRHLMTVPFSDTVPTGTGLDAA